VELGTTEADHGMEWLAIYRVIVFVPPEHLDGLMAGIAMLEGLRLGDYDQVMWISAPGQEQFRPLLGAEPALGRIGEVTKAPSVRLEFAIPRDDTVLRRVIEKGIRPHHPWEVPAILVDESRFPLP
jgi:hypothetical protein